MLAAAGRADHWLRMDGPIMTPLQARSLVDMRDNPLKRQHRKYSNVPTMLDGMRFDSKAEAKRWAELSIMQKAGLIHDLKRQVPFELVPACKRPSGGSERAVKYVADFTYTRDGKPFCEDVKGKAVDVYILKRKLMLWRHGIEVLETRA